MNIDPFGAFLCSASLNWSPTSHIWKIKIVTNFIERIYDISTARVVKVSHNGLRIKWAE